MSINTKMTAIADEIRTLSGGTGTMGLDAMASNLGDANTEVSNQADLISQIKIVANNLPQISTDGFIILQEKTATPTADSQTIVYDNEYDGLRSVTIVGDDNLIAGNIKTGVSIFGVDGNLEYETILQDKVITPSASEQTITADDGYDGLGNVVVSGDDNLVSENIKSGISIFGVNGTLEEAGDSVVDDVSSSILDGTITKFVDNNMTNIRDGIFAACNKLSLVSIPNASNVGAYAFYNCSTLTSADFPMCTTIGDYAFRGCQALTSVSFPVCNSIGSGAFSYCQSLTSVSLPVCTSIGNSAFYYCKSLTSANFPACTSIGIYAFGYCNSLASANLPVCTTVNTYAFWYCSHLTTVNLPACINIVNGAFSCCFNLSSLTLGASSVCKITNSSVFASTPYAGYSSSFSGTPYIYVPASLVDAYKSDKNWKYFSSYITAIVE